MRHSALAIVAISVLAACQGAPPSQQTAFSPSVARAAQPAYEVCGMNSYRALDKSGGTQRVPHIAKEREFQGSFSYASFSKKGDVHSLIFSCPTSDPIAPVPTGYTADWFGSWTLVCKSGCTGISFGPGSLSGQILSSSWNQATTYYLYFYTLYTRQYIGSYQIGPVGPGNKNEMSLSFSSPFQNGFTYPTNEAVALEIVH